MLKCNNLFWLKINQGNQLIFKTKMLMRNSCCHGYLYNVKKQSIVWYSYDPSIDSDEWATQETLKWEDNPSMNLMTML